jgi:hypothetical protein
MFSPTLYTLQEKGAEKRAGKTPYGRIQQTSKNLLTSNKRNTTDDTWLENTRSVGHLTLRRSGFRLLYGGALMCAAGLAGQIFLGPFVSCVGCALCNSASSSPPVVHVRSHIGTPPPPDPTLSFIMAAVEFKKFDPKDISWWAKREMGSPDDPYNQIPKVEPSSALYAEFTSLATGMLADLEKDAHTEERDNWESMGESDVRVRDSFQSRALLACSTAICRCA